jgi:hypothetical protein
MRDSLSDDGLGLRSVMRRCTSSLLLCDKFQLLCKGMGRWAARSIAWVSKEAAMAL